MNNTLYELYKSRGQELPSVQNRQADAISAGISDYTGTASQKQTLYNYLNSKPVTQTTSTVKPIQSPTTITSAQPTTQTLKTPADVFNLNNLGATKISDIRQPESQYAYDEPINEEDIVSKNLSRYQKEIDAINSVYSKMLQNQRVKGQSNLGSLRANQARSGMLGSDFSFAQDKQLSDSNTEEENLVLAQQSAEISKILGRANQDSINEIEKKREAKRQSTNDYIKYLENRRIQSDTNASSIAKQLLALNKDPNTLNDVELKTLQDAYGFTKGQLIEKYNTDKAKSDAEKVKTNPSFNLSEGQSRYTYDPITNGYTLIAENIKDFAPKTTKNIGIDSNGNPYQISAQAQTYVDAVNNGANLDEILKGTSRETQALRGEVIAGLNLQGGQTKKNIDLLQEGKSIVDDLISTQAYKALGGYSTKLGGSLSTAFGDAKAKAQRLEAILAKDNLGLLKGAMSDNDLRFIKSMSAGFEGQGIQSENYMKETMEDIQTKLENRINSFSNTQNNQLIQQLNQQSAPSLPANNKTYITPKGGIAF